MMWPKHSSKHWTGIFPLDDSPIWSTFEDTPTILLISSELSIRSTWWNNSDFQWANYKATSRPRVYHPDVTVLIAQDHQLGYKPTDKKVLVSVTTNDEPTASDGPPLAALADDCHQRNWWYQVIFLLPTTANVRFLPIINQLVCPIIDGYPYKIGCLIEMDWLGFARSHSDQPKLFFFPLLEPHHGL